MSAFAKSRILLSVLLFTLISIITIQPSLAQYPPHNLYVDSLTLGAQWDEPRDILIDEDFESGVFPPAGWQALTQGIAGWYATTDVNIPHFIVPSQTTYAVSSDNTASNIGCCDYLITPELNLTNLSSYYLTFKSFFSGAFNQHAFVEISTNAGLNWDVVYTLNPEPSGWQELEIDLSQYSGPEGHSSVWFAFHADDYNEWASGWAIDDIMISSGNISIQGYAVFLDGELIDTALENSFDYSNLNFRQEYLAGVAAIYSGGLSEPDTFQFVSSFLYPPKNLQGIIPGFTEYVHLWWQQPENRETKIKLSPGLLGYNVYKDDSLIAYVEQPDTEYFDLNLNNGIFLYHVTAVYDLAYYGYPGEIGESMISGPVEINFLWCYQLPFTENFNTGLFETNQWGVIGDNWRIAGQVGNQAPGAEFYKSPSATNYSQALTSFCIDGTSIVDGQILLEFDVKHTLGNPTGNEFLTVDIYNGTTWLEVIEYSNISNFNWLAQSFDITDKARGNYFQVRFRTHGYNTLDIFNWLIDNVHIYRICPAPSNFYLSINFPNFNEVHLNWEAPSGGGAGVSEWLAWDNSSNDDAIGLLDGGTFNVAVRFTPIQLQEYIGSSLTKIRMFPYGPNGKIVLKVWTGANASQLVLSQPVSDYIAGQWNEFMLNTPVLITAATELWFGYTVTHNSTDYVAGCDEGPAVVGFGDMISLDGSVWESMATAYALNFNWNLHGYIETIDGVTILHPIGDNIVYDPVSMLVHGNLPMLPNAKVTNRLTKNGRSLMGYSIWRQFQSDPFININFTSETEYIDKSVLLNKWYCYYIYAVYEDCESEATAEDCLFTGDIGIIDIERISIQIYPNPSNSIINIELTNDISQIVIYNYVGQVVYEQIVTKDKNIQLNVRTYEAGAYLIKFITNSGDSFTKKVAVTH